MSKYPDTRQGRYREAVVRNLAAELSDDCLLCPKCGQAWVVPDDSLASRLGVCQGCYLRSLAEAQRIAANELAARREYDRERRRAYNERKKISEAGA